MTKRYGWTYRVLINHIENQSYEKFLLNQTNFDETVPQKYQDQAKLAVKDEYVFDFLELGKEHTERELESAIVQNIGKFLTQMGNDFAFMGNQYRLEVDGDEYFIDLLLFHRRLKSLIAIELKIGKFKPEYAGKMNFYLSALNDLVRLEDENPSIGMIICKDKNRTTVEYALRDSNKPIGVSSYQLLHKLPLDLQSFLPNVEEIVARLSIFDDRGEKK
jgi:predicted nuclease of restriction endonuclease-like (RecB) superfamily